MWQIIGHERPVSLLQQSQAAGRLSHAYLFTGSEHIGKMTLALNLAQLLNCESDAPPCYECPACRKIAADKHPDVQVIGITRKDDGEERKNISIEQVRDIQHDASLPPFEGKHKVFIIENAELLTTDAANCFLKTLEEPVPGVTFILLTVNEALLPETVVSRCLRLELLPVPAENIVPALQERGIDVDRADLLARLSGGCPGWAVLAAADDDLLEKRREELEKLRELMTADYEDRFAWAGQTAAKFTRDRREMYGMLDRWLGYWRDLMLVKLGCRDMIVNTDRREELEGISGSLRLDQIRDCMQSLAQASWQLAKNINPRLALEVLMLDIPRLQGGIPGSPPQRAPVANG